MNILKKVCKLTGKKSVENKRNIKLIKKKVVAGLLIAAIVITGQIQAISVKAASVKVKSVKVTSDTGKTAYVAKGKTIQLKTDVSVTPAKSTNKKVTYKSNNKKIATVSSKGVVKGIKTGTTTIKVTSKSDKNKSAKITVKVTTPVSKLTLNKSKLSLSKGKTQKLTVKYKPAKNICKTVKWTSSNKKVATVSDDGIVKAVGKGSAKITAQALDGTNKKSNVCTVTVTEANNIASVEVINSSVVRVTLSKAQALAAKDFTVQIKSYQSGNYIAACGIESLKTADKKIYDITMKDRFVSEGGFVKVTIQSLSGNGIKSKEAMYKGKKGTQPQNQYITGYVGKSVYKELYMGDYTNGELSVSVDKLPAGLKYKVSGRYIVIEGTPTQAANSTLTKIICTDELGKKVTQNVYFCIGSTSFIAGYSRGEEIYPEQDCDVGVYFYGGSGSYTFEIIGENYGLSLSRSSGTSCYLEGRINSPGTYNVKVRANDSVNTKLIKEVTVSIKVIPTVIVKGTVKDAFGSLAAGVKIRFYSSNPDSMLSYRDAIVDSKGEYYITVAPGTYDIRVNYGEYYDYTYKKTVGNNGNNDLNIMMDAYKVTINPNLSGSFHFESWYKTEDDEYIESGNIMYLKAGNYNLKCTAYSLDSNGNYDTKYEAKVTFTITNKSVTINATLTKWTLNSVAVGTLTVGTPINVSTTYGDYVYLKFIPEESGTYAIYSTAGVGDPYGVLYNESENRLTYNDDGGTGSNFRISYSFEKGKTYYIGIKDYDDDSLVIPVHAEYVED